MENLPERSRKKHEIDYENSDDQEWMDYVHKNISPDTHDVPFPGSSWSYTRNDSHFDKEDALKCSDESLREIVQNTLYVSHEVDASCIIVDVINGNVSLSGKVDSEARKVKASNLVSKIRGVWKVINNLEVSPVN